MTQLGIIVEHLGASQLSYLVTSQVNQFGGTIFEKVRVPPIQPVKGCVLPIHQITKFKDVLIATDLDSARYLINLASPTRKLFYPWTMEWLKHGNNYIETVKVFTDPLIEVIAKSESYAAQIRLMNREPSAIIQELNFDNIRAYCKQHPEIRRYTNTREVMTSKPRKKTVVNGHNV